MICAYCKKEIENKKIHLDLGIWGNCEGMKKVELCFCNDDEKRKYIHDLLWGKEGKE